MLTSAVFQGRYVFYKDLTRSHGSVEIFLENNLEWGDLLCSMYKLYIFDQSMSVTIRYFGLRFLVREYFDWYI